MLCYSVITRTPCVTLHTSHFPTCYLPIGLHYTACLQSFTAVCLHAAEHYSQGKAGAAAAKISVVGKVKKHHFP